MIKTRWDRIVTVLLLSAVVSLLFKSVLKMPITGLIVIAFLPSSMRLLGFPLFEVDIDKSDKI